MSIKSEDGEIFQCHKCILVARLEYFHSMLASGWMEVNINVVSLLDICIWVNIIIFFCMFVSGYFTTILFSVSIYIR